VTPDYNPGGKGGTYNDAGVFNDISVWYMGTRENVFDGTSPPPVRAAFNLADLLQLAHRLFAG